MTQFFLKTSTRIINQSSRNFNEKKSLSLWFFKTVKYSRYALSVIGFMLLMQYLNPLEFV